MNSENNKKIALKWFAAFNQHNLENLLSLYAENAEHYSPKLKARIPDTNGLIKGKNSLNEWWKDAFARLPSLKYEPKKIVADEDTVFMEYIRHVANEEKLMVCEVFEIKNNMIIFSRVYHS